MKDIKKILVLHKDQFRTLCESEGIITCALCNDKGVIEITDGYGCSHCDEYFTKIMDLDASCESVSSDPPDEKSTQNGSPSESRDQFLDAFDKMSKVFRTTIREASKESRAKYLGIDWDVKPERLYSGDPNPLICTISDSIEDNPPPPPTTLGFLVEGKFDTPNEES